MGRRPIASLCAAGSLGTITVVARAWRTVGGVYRCAARGLDSGDGRYLEAYGEHQRAALTALKDLFLAGHTPEPGGPPLSAAQVLAEVALLLSLPEPSSAEEADAQIAALQGGSLRDYAVAHPTWAFPVMSRVQARMPDPAQVPERQRNGAPWTAAAWRTHVWMLLRAP